jgi:hypothetical protein
MSFLISSAEIPFPYRLKEAKDGCITSRWFIGRGPEFEPAMSSSVLSAVVAIAIFFVRL